MNYSSLIIPPTPTGWVICIASIPRAKALRYMPSSLRDVITGTRKAGAGM